MSRSTKKGPYVQPVLLKRVIEMNEENSQDLVKKFNNFP